MLGEEIVHLDVETRKISLEEKLKTPSKREEKPVIVEATQKVEVVEILNLVEVLRVKEGSR